MFFIEFIVQIHTDMICWGVGGGGMQKDVAQSCQANDFDLSPK